MAIVHDAGAQRPTLLLLAATSSYRLADFRAAADADGVRLLVGTDRCHEIGRMFPEAAFGTLELDFRDLEAAVKTVTERAASATKLGEAIVAVIPTDERTSLLAAKLCAALGLRGNPVLAAETTRSKAGLRAALAAASRPQPAHRVVELADDPASAAAALGYPVVVKPLLLSGSRGVIRCNDADELAAATLRLRRLLDDPELRANPDPDGHRLIVESYIDGAEVAVEAILHDGVAQILAIFDKPDPLVGPYFEETIYTTPCRLPEGRQRELEAEVRAAIAAVGLSEGPVHAEVRVPPAGAPIVLEVAARSIGGLCARSLRFGLGLRTLESLVLDAALGRPVDTPLVGASGVLMIPIPRGGVLTAFDGVKEARAVRGIEELVISVELGRVLVPLPEGASYLGFIFARDPERSSAGAARVEAALRKAHARLRFMIRPTLS